MNTLPAHFSTRLVWLAIGVVPGLVLLTEGIASHRIGQLLQGLGMVLLGGVWFLHPILFKTQLTKPMGEPIGKINETAIGPLKLRAALAVSAATFLIGGAALRYAFTV